MKTLILNGSPRIKGDTFSLIEKITALFFRIDWKIIGCWK